jgi:hypothetical protein
MSWERTYQAPEPGTYQVTLPFHPGEWESAPINTSYAIPYSWHPDGTVRRVTFYHEPEVGEVKIDSGANWTDMSYELSPPPYVELAQAEGPENLFPVPADEWVETNTGVVATRTYTGRPSNQAKDCDFAVSVNAFYWKGVMKRLEVRWTGCNPDDPIRRNFPFATTWIGEPPTSNDQIWGITIGDKMSFPWRDDKVIYAVCNEWEGHACGSNGVDYTRVQGGSLQEIHAGVATKNSLPWWESFWIQPNSAGSGGMHAGFGVCRLAIAAALQAKETTAWPALHYLGQECMTAQYHLTDSAGQILEYPLDHPHSWSTTLGGARGDLPHFGKTVDAEEVTAPNHGTEPNSHMRAHTLSSIMEIAPTPMYAEEFGFRAQAILNIYGGEERAYARVGYGVLEILPFVQGQLRADLLAFASGRMRYQLAEYKKAGYRAHREDGPADKWIPGKKVFLPWQDGMLFGHIWACHLSGYPELKLTEDELTTVDLTTKWLVDNCWRWNEQEGRWQGSYASAVDLSEHVWTDPGTSAQGLAGLEPIKDYPRAAQILSNSGVADMDRWYPQRPVVPESEKFLTRGEVEALQQHLSAHNVLLQAIVDSVAPLQGQIDMNAWIIDTLTQKLEG